MGYTLNMGRECVCDKTLPPQERLCGKAIAETKEIAIVKVYAETEFR